MVEFKNGLKKILAHDTDMKIPIFNTLYQNKINFIKTKKIDLDKLNNLNFKKVDFKKFPLVKILKKIPQKNSLFETILISANDELVSLYLKKLISFNDIQKRLFQIINLREFKAYKNKKPKNIGEINKLNAYVRLKIKRLCI